MTFSGFDSAAVALLGRLPSMTAEEYAAHRATLTAGLTRPAGELIADVAALLDADLTVVARSSISPLHRDLRFAPEGTPRYKDHLLLTTWEGADKRSSPTLWVRLDAERVGFASGIGFDPSTRERWRSAVGGVAGEGLGSVLDRLAVDRAADVAGDRLKNVPAPFDADHARAELLRHTGFQVRFVEPLPASVAAPSFVDWCAERLDALMPVHRWLRDHLTD